MMTAEFMLSKRSVLRFTAALFFLLKLFSSHIYCIPKNEHCFAQLKEPDDSLHRLFRRYSNFQNLLRTVSWLLRYKNFLCDKLFENHSSANSSANVGFFTVEELDQARLAIMRCVQRKAFSQIYALSSGRYSSNLTKSIKVKDLQQNED